MARFLTIVARSCRLLAFSVVATFIAIIGKHIPALDRIVMRNLRAVLMDSTLKEEDWKDSIYSFAQLKTMTKNSIYDVFRDAELYHDAPDGDVIKGDLSKSRLLEFQKKDRPLILNFGSCT